MRGWAGPTAFVLAFGVAAALATALVIIALSPQPLDSQLEVVITTIAGAAIGAVGTYLGTTAQRTTHVYRKASTMTEQPEHDDTDPEAEPTLGDEGMGPDPDADEESEG